jgi:hypothetical protein
MSLVPSEYLIELVKAKVAPIDLPYDEGISTSAGKTLPFFVEREWSGPAGTYWETWSIRRGGREVIYSARPQQVKVSGMQSIRRFVDRVDEPIQIEPGTYQLVFIVEGRFMGSREIEVLPPDEAAA